jgi:CDP-diacylglycerol---glycerol-3-phosphate 3-phosphatidyltransferase
MNLPNALTFLRIILGFIVPYFMLSGDFWLQIWAAILFAVAAFSDWFDGWYARRYNLITKMGQILDPIADKILVLGTFFVLSSATSINMYSIWWVVPILVREIVITVYRLLFLMQKKPVVVAAESMGKAKTVLQMMTLPFAYFYYMIFTYGQVEVPLLTYMLYAMLVASVYFTVHSGVEFFVKNWRTITKVSF